MSGQVGAKMTKTQTKTFSEKLAEHKLAGLIVQPCQMPVWQRVNAYNTISGLQADIAENPDDRVMVDVLTRVLGWIRENACPDVDAFDKASVGMSAIEGIEFTTLFVNALGE